MRNPVARFNRMVMRNPAKWGMFTAGVTFSGAALLMLAGVLEDPVGSGLWYFALVAGLLCATCVGFFAWGFVKFHRLEKKLDAAPETDP